MTSKFKIQDLEAPGWQVLVSLTATWPVVRHGEDLLGDFRAAAKTFRLRAVLEGLRQCLLNAKPSHLEGVKLVVVNQLPGSTTDRIGAALLAAPEAGRRLGAGVAQQIGAEMAQALNALQSEAYRRTVNLDLVDELRRGDAERPAWMPKEQAIDPIRAALVRAGRRQTLWRRVRSASAEQFDIPLVPHTEPVVVGSIAVDGSIISVVDRTRRLSVQGACKASAVVRKLGISARTFSCQVDDQKLFARIRALPPGQSMTLEMDVVDVIAHGGELRRSCLVTGLKES
ncbi:hypothetical protein BurJ1DRAFT_0427 [Burkholderiales bacterium JOSHI_001]|nr:hypothetical protein BurJ1DRAFT_0427 [Burkholderiales bacterium JOSHI_001]